MFCDKIFALCANSSQSWHSCTKLINHCKTHTKTYFAMEYRICTISSQSWHLHWSDFPWQNTQIEVFCREILHLCNLKSDLTVAQIWFSIVKLWKTCFVVEYRICVISSQSWHLHISDFPLKNSQKDVFCGRIMHLFNLKSELTVAQIGFPTVKHSKRRVLRCIIAFVQIQVRVGTYK